MAVTQKQIADKLQVSRSLVGRTLNGGGRVSPELKERILATAREMGYDLTDNREARALIAQRYGRTLKNGTIAIAYALDTSLGNIPFFEPVVRGMEDEAIERKTSICLCPLRADELPPLIRSKNVDGVIILGGGPWAEIVHEAQLPITHFHWREEDASSIRPDDREGARQATQHLLDLGHRRIAYLGLVRHQGYAYRERLKGYRDAMQEHGIPVRDEWIEHGGWPLFSPTTHCSGCGICAACIGWSTLMEKNGGFGKNGELPFTAVVCHNDTIAMGVIAEARDNGVDVPRDLSVVGFDDTSSRYNFEPTVTSVHLPLYEMGRCAVSLLDEAIANEGEPVYQHRMLPVSLAIHDSTAKVSERTLVLS